MKFEAVANVGLYKESCLCFHYRGKKDPDVILIGKMETGLSQKRKRGSLGNEPNGTQLSEDKNTIKRENKGKTNCEKKFKTCKMRILHYNCKMDFMSVMFFFCR